MGLGLRVRPSARAPPARAQGPPRRQGREPGRDDLGAGPAGPARASRSPPRPASPTWPTAGPTGLDDEIAEHVAALEEAMGRRFGDPADPLLLSVRSGAKFSMPGMMDTILNLGLNDESAEGLAEVTGHRWFALDSHRRLIQMYGTTVLRRGRRGVRPRQDDLRRGRAWPRRSSASAAVEPSAVGAAVPAGSRPCSSARRSRPSSARGTRLGPTPTAGGRASPTTSAPPSTSRSWSSATATTGRAPAWASPGTRRPAQRALRRLPGQRPGRGRRRRHPQHAAAGRVRRALPGPGGRAGGDLRRPRAALPGHDGHRVHHRAGQALDPPDPGRQADRAPPPSASRWP